MSHQYSTTTIIKAPASRIYGFYVDVPNWKAWDSELEYSSLKTDFLENAIGVLKAKGNDELEFVLKNVKDNVGFMQIMNLPMGSKFILTRLIIERDSDCEVTHSGYFEGFFGSIIGLILKSKYAPLLQKSVLKLKELCEKSN